MQIMDEAKEFSDQNQLYDCLKWVLIAAALIIIYHIAIYAAGYEVTSKSTVLAQNTSEPADYLQGPCELQELLNKIEPSDPVKIDGRIGPETLTKWNRVWFNQCAAKTFKKSE